MNGNSRNKVNTTYHDKIVQYISKKFEEGLLELTPVDKSTIKGTGKNGFAVLFHYDEESEKIILKDYETGIGMDLYQVHRERKICEKHPERYKQIKGLQKELAEVSREYVEIRKMLNEQDSPLLPKDYKKMSAAEKKKFLKEQSNKMPILEAHEKELRSEIKVIEFDSDREKEITYLNEQKRSLTRRLQEIKESQNSRTSIDEESDDLGVDQLIEQLDRITQKLRTQSYLRKLVGLHPNNTKIYYLAPSERTIEKLDAYLDSGREFFIIETVFCINGPSKVFHTNFAKVHLVISDRSWQSCNALSVTMTELKRNEFIYVDTFQDGSPYQIVNHAHMTRDLAELTDVIEKLYAHSKKTQYIYQNVALFERPIQLRAQSSTERYYERYGTTENYYIIGAIFESRITFVEWFTIEKKMFDRDGMSPHFERLFSPPKKKKKKKSK